MSSNSAPAQTWKPKAGPYVTAFAVMLAPFMEVLDTSVANVALPHMSGSFSATSEEILWVITSYLIANGIIIPTTAWFSGFFGRKRFLSLCIIIFTLSSALCGAANSLGLMVIARIIQGAGGGALVPISQSILLESFPPEKRGVGMAIFGLGIIVAPIIGPVLGGFITDHYSWRWIFYINIPVGILAIVLINLLIEDPLYIKKGNVNRIDYIGFSALIVWLVTLQIILDKGQQADWFASNWVCWMSALSFCSMVFFIIWELTYEDRIINLKVFGDLNFTMGSILSMFVGAVLYGTLAMLPLFLQTLMGYSALKSGLTVAPRGMGAFTAMVLAGILSDKIPLKIQIGSGFLLLFISNYMLANINFQIAPQNIIFPNILSGIGISFIFIPLTTAAFMTLKNEQIGNATGLFNLMRNIGGGIGTSLVSTMLSRNAQKHQAYMVDHLNSCSAVFQEKLNIMSNYLSMNMDSVTASLKANKMMYLNLLRQTNLFSFVDNFKMFGIISLFVIPSVLVFKELKSVSGKSKMMMH